MLVGSTGLPINLHLCGGEVKAVSLWVDAPACHAEKMKACPFHPAPADDEDGAKENKDCCQDEHAFVQLDSERDLPTTQPATPIPAALPAPPARIFADYTLPARHTTTALKYYRPPPLVIDAPRQWQVFRL